MDYFSYRRLIRNHESDSTGLLQASNYFRLMEECECAFFRSLGLSFFKKGSDTVFPRVSTRLTTLYPIKNGDKIVINTYVKRLGGSSMTLRFLFYKEEDVEQKLEIANGEFSVVSCVYDKVKNRLKSVPIERGMRSKILGYL